MKRYDDTVNFEQYGKQLKAKVAHAAASALIAYFGAVTQNAQAGEINPSDLTRARGVVENLMSTYPTTPASPQSKLAMNEAVKISVYSLADQVGDHNGHATPTEFAKAKDLVNTVLGEKIMQADGNPQKVLQNPAAQSLTDLIIQ